ncbi:MAG: ATP-binding protein [Phenylobacterium sp.]
MAQRPRRSTGDPHVQNSPAESAAPSLAAPASGLSMGLLGDLGLNALREAALRAGRLAEALFDAPEADVLAVNEGRVWRGKPPRPDADDNAGRRIALWGGGPVWVADSKLDPEWSDHPAIARTGIRFLAAAPIRLRDGTLVGALRVLDLKPRPFDPQLAERLTDLAAFVAGECDRVLGGETRMIRDLFNRAPGMMAVTRGPEHVFELANPAYHRFVGGRDLIGLPVHEALPHVVPQGFKARLDEVYRTGKPYAARASRMMIQPVQGGEMVEAFVDFVFEPIRDTQGAVTGIFFQGHDVTTAKRATDKLESSQHDLEAALSALQTVFDQSLDVICTVDAEGRFMTVNRRSQDMWGRAPQSLAGRNFAEFIHPADHDAAVATAMQIRKGRPTTDFPSRFMHKDGSAIPMAWSAVWSDTHQLIFAVGRDMREHDAAEAKLRQSQKMEALGQLTGGVAHDFNNLLTVVIGSAETLTESLAEDARMQPLAQLILDAAESGAELVNRLLAFSRKQSLSPKVMDAEILFQHLLPLVRRTLGADIEIATQSDPKLRWMADPAHLTSALINLCINARDAMPGGGRITLRVRRVRSDPDDTARDGVEGPLVGISVEDNGHGMTPETVQRALEPFFTTKPTGKGSGLGLSMVYGFAKQSGGRLRINSQVGRGTRVSLHLPEAGAPAPEQTTAKAPVEAVAGPDRARILLVEDDARVRRQAELQLKSLGYDVTASANGADALTLLDEASRFDLLVTDIVMPGGINGRQLANQARARFPDLPILFTSGYSDEALVRAARLTARTSFLPKPYRRARLAEAIREALNHA